MTFKDSTQKTVFDFYANYTGMGKKNGHVGLEIEMEGEGIIPGGWAIKGWEAHQDNSLRGPKGHGHGGIEYTTRGAIPMGEVFGAVTNLNNMLKKEGVTLREDSPRTSTHIHLNVQQNRLIDVYGYLAVFAAVEPLFLHLCGPRRDGNSFCVSSFDTGDLPEWFHTIFGQIDRGHTGGDLQQRGKYASLGTFRLHDLGTLEGRCFPFSLDPGTIERWCQWMVNIMSVVVAEQDKSMRQVIKLGINDPMILVNRIFGAVDVSQYFAAELVSYGSREAYELTRLLKHYLNKQPGEKKRKGYDNPPDIIDEVHEAVADNPGVQFARWQADVFAGAGMAPQAGPALRHVFAPRRRIAE